jgi:hypothetical protein
MRNLLQDADRDRLAAPLAALAGEVTVGGRPLRALAEAEGSAFFPALGNARAAELLLMPGLREAHEALGDAVLDFVMAMAEATPPAARAFAPGIEVLRDDPRDLEVVTPFFRFSGDLRAGAPRQQARHWVGAAPALRHAGNLVEFRLGRRAACVDVEDAIAEAAVEQTAEGVVLRHEGVIHGMAGLFGPRQVEAGRIAYRYLIRPDSPVVTVEVRFTATRAISQLQVTTALDAMEEEGVAAGAARLLSGGAWRDLAAPDAPGAAGWARRTAVAHLALGAVGWPAGAAVAHLRPHDPARVFSVVAHGQRGGAVHWLLLRYGPVDLAAGETLTLSEDRLLAAGEVASVAGLMAGGAAPGLDLDPRPATGAALQAVATALLLDASGAWRARLPEARRAELAAFADRQAARLAEGTRVEELAAGMIGADALRRLRGAAAGDALARLRPLLSAALAAAPGGLAARALGALALARAATWADGTEAAAQLAPVLAPIEGSAPGFAPQVTLDGVPVDPRADAEGVAILARAAGAVVLAAAAGAALDPALVERMRRMHRTAIALVRPLARPRDAWLEMAGPQGLEPRLQAAATLAFLAPERLVLGAGRAAA